MVSEEIALRKIPVVFKTLEDIEYSSFPFSRTDFVVGTFEFTRLALKRMKIPMPNAEDYPECLQHLLHRRIWKTTMKDLREQLERNPTMAPCFFKPAVELKDFNGEIASLDWVNFLMMEYAVKPSLQIWCSEVVEMISEYRVYIVRGAIRAICRYKGPEEPLLDTNVVEEAVRAFYATSEHTKEKG